jgi:ribosomal protein S16
MAVRIRLTRVGAQPSDTVARLFRNAGVLPAGK